MTAQHVDSRLAKPLALFYIKNYSGHANVVGESKLPCKVPICKNTRIVNQKIG